MSEQVISVTEKKEGVEETAVSTQTSSTKDTGRLSLQQLIWRRFLQNRLAVIGGITLIFLYVVCVLFPGFIAPYHPTTSNEDYVSMAPQLPRFFDEDGNFHLRPFVYGTTVTLDTEDLIWIHEIDYSTTISC